MASEEEEFGSGQESGQETEEASETEEDSDPQQEFAPGKQHPFSNFKNNPRRRAFIQSSTQVIRQVGV